MMISISRRSKFTFRPPLLLYLPLPSPPCLHHSHTKQVAAAAETVRSFFFFFFFFPPLTQ